MSLVVVGGIIGWVVLAALTLRGNAGFERSPQEGGQGGAIG
jgi:hypothetical protein